MLRVDHPAEPTPQAVTLLDPATGAAAWYHRRWNWRSSQAPVLSHAQDLVGLSGPRADNPDDYQTRILRTRTGEEVATVRFGGAPGLLMAMSDDRLLYVGDRGEVFTAYDFSGARLWGTTMPNGCKGAAAQMTGARLVMLADCVPAPDRAVARDYVLAFDLDDGALVWQREVDRRARVAPESFLVTEDAVVIDSRTEVRVSDGPYSARRFEHKLLAFDTADGELLWRKRDQVFGSTHTSACGGTLYLSNPTAHVEALGEAGSSPAKPSVGDGGRRTVQLVECYAATHRQGSWLGVMTYDLHTGEQLYHKAIKLGYTPLEAEVARGWATVLPDNRALLTSDFSLDPTIPDCRLYEIEDGEAERLDVAEEGLPEAWCHDAQLTAVAGGVAISYVNDDGTRGIALVS
nr:PQQ-binding-like beta-propeller repeat protein [Glycomyces sp. L485]